MVRNRTHARRLRICWETQMSKAPRCLAALLLLTAAARSADAADLGDRAIDPVGAYAPCWTGFYVGLGGGMSSLNSALNAQPAPDMAGNPGASGASASFNGLGADGGFFELNAGADYQINSWLVRFFRGPAR
jgi:hypothetical protein